MNFYYNDIRERDVRDPFGHRVLANVPWNSVDQSLTLVEDPSPANQIPGRQRLDPQTRALELQATRLIRQAEPPLTAEDRRARRDDRIIRALAITRSLWGIPNRDIPRARRLVREDPSLIAFPVPTRACRRYRLRAAPFPVDPEGDTCWTSFEQDLRKQRAHPHAKRTLSEVRRMAPVLPAFPDDLPDVDDPNRRYKNGRSERTYGQFVRIPARPVLKITGGPHKNLAKKVPLKGGLCP